MPRFEITNYSEHALSSGEEASAIAYIQIKHRRRQDPLGRRRGHEHRTRLGARGVERAEPELTGHRLVTAAYSISSKRGKESNIAIMKAFGRIMLGVMLGGGLFTTVHLATGAQVPGSPPHDAHIQPPIQPLSGPQTVLSAPAVPNQVAKISDFLAWDASQKEAVAAFGQMDVHFKFAVTNISKEVVTIFKVTTSCGCTTVHLPPMPWALAPGTNVELNVTLNLAGKMGLVFKTVTVSTDKGNKVLMVKGTVQPATNSPAMGSREQNMKMAMADRQAVFKGDCARCHLEPGTGKKGKELYMAICGVCHEAEHRASMVPDLHNLNHETSHELWTVWINFGKPGSLMPAFAKPEGGPLTQEQIRSLADYLTATIPNKPGQPAPPAPK